MLHLSYTMGGFMSIKDYFLRKLLRFILIALFWLPFIFGIFKEVRRACGNLCIVSSIKYEYRMWLRELNNTRNYSANDKVDELHK